ncbi:hypothetical protein HELRODRAFT_168164 [Helobdella robusta]|uniref:Uncharacterized protein n=1 Tax=Helobdella robusta TaxID=6412 RepID=T1F092_HELRO|nr:hypothetical protein HELRODRAFT_168164 [Helobdella robusta]ESO09205.1 hypothetical protein HELRODRAFT_168164 [Helobdella robusta]
MLMSVRKKFYCKYPLLVKKNKNSGKRINDQSANGHSNICITNSNIPSNKCYYEQIVSRNCYVAKKRNDRLLLSDFQTVIGEKWMDGHNCGIFIYMVMDTLDESKPIGNEFDPIRCRLKIFDDVIANSDNMINECLFCCNESADELWIQCQNCFRWVHRKCTLITCSDWTKSNGDISPLLKAQLNRQIFTVNLEQEIAKGIGGEELLNVF